MPDTNKQVLTAANARVTSGDYAGFLEYCTTDTRWEFVGDRTLDGKAAVLAYMKQTYAHPPVVTVTRMIEEGDMLAVYGDITLTDAAGTSTTSAYCDVWRLRDGKLHELRAFVVDAKPR